ncbi:MAG: hypothetical protein EAZ58_13590 [Flavobacterium sp.]|nr:MAG: hypothetical protein EAZ58_13590 [Flavobacterium sp.]
MLNLQEQRDLREKVSKNEISVSLAKEIYWKDLTTESRSWQTSDWKKRRDEVLKDKCELCDSKEILTIQHLSHPKKYNYYVNEVTKIYLNTSKDSEPIIQKQDFIDHIQNNYEYQPVPLCPRCENRKPNPRMKKEPKFLCTNCHLEFDEPTFWSMDKLVNLFYENDETIAVKDKCFISKDKWKNQHHLKLIKYWFVRNNIKVNNTEKIEKEAFLLFLDDNIKYLSFDDTLTACKKCASNFDLNNLELCPNCRKFYKSIKYPTCIQCLPERIRKGALEKVEFGKQMSEIHKNFDID